MRRRGGAQVKRGSRSVVERAPERTVVFFSAPLTMVRALDRVARRKSLNRAELLREVCLKLTSNGSSKNSDPIIRPPNSRTKFQPNKNQQARAH